jgi:hypothetical protein
VRPAASRTASPLHAIRSAVPRGFLHNSPLSAVGGTTVDRRLSIALTCLLRRQVAAIVHETKSGKKWWEFRLSLAASQHFCWFTMIVRRTPSFEASSHYSQLRAQAH